MNVKLNKTIDAITPRPKYIHFTSGNEWRNNKYVLEFISLKFFSQTPDKHQLLIDIPKLEDIQDEFITYDPEQLYLWWDEVIALENAISDNAVKNYISEVKKKQNIEEEFE